MKRLSVIVPVFNEEKNLPEFFRQVLPILRATGLEWELIFAMDPSRDRTEQLILEHRTQEPGIRLLRLSRRFGQPAATLAGLSYSRGDLTLVMDCDLQDPPDLIPEMITRVKSGYDVVVGRRRSRAGETWVKRLISSVGYRMIRSLSEIEIPADTGDFRMMTRRVTDEVLRLGETHGFLRGMVALVGFPTVAVYFDRPPRHSGVGNYNRFTGSLLIGINGLVGFSNRLLRSNTVVGAVLLVLALVVALTGYEPSNRAVLASVIALAALVLLGQGLQGAYIGRIYDETRRRPRYIVERAWGFD